MIRRDIHIILHLSCVIRDGFFQVSFPIYAHLLVFLKSIMADVFGSYRYHNQPPKRVPKEPEDLLKLLKENERVGDNNDQRIQGRLYRVSEMLVDASRNLTEEQAQERVFNCNKQELLRLLVKLRVPFSFFLDKDENTQRATHLSDCRKKGIPTTTLTLETGNPLTSYGIRYLMESGERYAPLYMCCLQVPQAKGCLIGYQDESKNVPYRWFGGLKDVSEDQYDDIVKNNRGIVYLDKNLNRCNEMHEKIVAILISPEIKTALVVEKGLNIYKNDILKQLWQVAEYIYAYNEHLYVTPESKGWPSEYLKKYDMIAYLKTVLPVNFTEAFEKMVQEENKEVDKALEKLLAVVKKFELVPDSKKVRIEAGELLKKFNKLLKTLKEINGEDDDEDEGLDINLFDDDYEPKEILSKIQDIWYKYNRIK